MRRACTGAWRRARRGVAGRTRHGDTGTSNSGTRVTRRVSLRVHLGLKIAVILGVGHVGPRRCRHCRWLLYDVFFGLHLRVLRVAIREAIAPPRALYAADRHGLHGMRRRKTTVWVRIRAHATAVANRSHGGAGATPSGRHGAPSARHARPIDSEHVWCFFNEPNLKGHISCVIVCCRRRWSWRCSAPARAPFAAARRRPRRRRAPRRPSAAAPGRDRSA